MKKAVLCADLRAVLGRRARAREDAKRESIVIAGREGRISHASGHWVRVDPGGSGRRRCR